MKSRHAPRSVLLLVLVVFGWGYPAKTGAGPPPPFEVVITPTNQIGAVFGSAMFTASATTGLPVTYQWFFDKVAIEDATNSSLILSPLTYGQSGDYSVTVMSTAGSVSASNAVLNVAQAIVSDAPESYTSVPDQDILLQFTNLLAVNAGSTTIVGLQSCGTIFAVFDCTDHALPSLSSNVVSFVLGPYVNGAATGAEVESNGSVMTWDFDRPGPLSVPSAVTNVTAVAAGKVPGSNYFAALRNDGTVVAWIENTTGPLQIVASNAVALTAGFPELLVVNADGTILQSTNVNWPPVLKQVAGVSNIIAVPKGYYALGLEADGTIAGWGALGTNPLPGVSNIVEFALNSQGLDYLLALEANGTVAGNPNLTSYFPVALTNVFGVEVTQIDDAGIALFDSGTPVVTVQPANQVLTNGGTIWLHVRAVGQQPMGYQWELDGNTLEGATNDDLIITNAQGYNTGSYFAFVSNQVGSAASSNASATIPVRHLSGQLGNPTLLPEGGIVFSVLSPSGQPILLSSLSNIILEQSTDLVHWVPVTSGLSLSAGSIVLQPVNPANSTAAYYRLMYE